MYDMSTVKEPGKENITMDFIVWLAVGALIGWVASMIMKTDAQMGQLRTSL